MAERKRIGLRDVRALRPNQILWDSAVAGFHARRQRGPGVTYVVFYRTAEGRQRIAAAQVARWQRWHAARAAEMSGNG